MALFNTYNVLVYYTFYFAPGRDAKYCDEYVCLSVCLSIHITQKPHCQTLQIFLRILPVAMARFASDGIAICYVLLFLWMMSCFHTIWSVGQKQIRHYVSVDIRQLQCLVRMRHWGWSLLPTIDLCFVCFYDNSKLSYSFWVCMSVDNTVAHHS